MKLTRVLACATAVASMAVASSTVAQTPQGTGFTYQGLLFDAGGAADGTYDMRFTVFAQPMGGAALAPPVQIGAVPVSDGRFTVVLDFGKFVFDQGEARWLELAVSDGGPFVTLAPRQRITPAPVATFAQNSAQAKSRFRILDVDGTGPTLLFGDGDLCSLGVLPDVQGLTASDPGGLRVRNPLTGGLGGRLRFGSGDDCEIFADPLGPAGLNVSDPGGIRVRNPVPGLPIRIVFGPTDDCGIIVDPAGPNGLILRDPRGIRIVPPVSPAAARLRFGVTDLCEIVAGEPFPPGLNLRDPSGVRIVNPFVGGPVLLSFGETDQCVIRVGGPEPGMTFGDPSGFRFIGGFLGLNIPQPEVGIQLPPIPGPPGTGLAAAWQTYSSRRFKENVAPFEGALEIVAKLEGVTFNWSGSGRHDIGFIAEEVATVLPEIVSMEEDGAWARSMDYARLTVVAVEAIKEQQTQIEQLRDQNAALRSELEALRELVNRLHHGQSGR